MASISTDAFANSMSPTVAIGPPLISPTQPRQLKWTYEEAFKRNRGLITEKEQEKLRNSRVAIAGMGGVGGLHLITLARLGIGRFTIADPDTFEVANFNRQYGATISNLGRNKAEAMASAALDINPELEVRVMPKSINASNIDEFLDSADLFVDGLDFFANETRRMAFRRAAALNMWAITAGPIGFGAALLIFDPHGMEFDNYFALDDQMTPLEMLVSFAVGLTPKGMHLKYMDLSEMNTFKGAAPCSSLACSLVSSIAADRIMQILLARQVASVPYYEQFDPHMSKYVRRCLHFGNRHPIQRLKRRVLLNKFSKVQLPLLS